MKRKISLAYKLAILSLIINFLVLIYFVYKTLKLRQTCKKKHEINANSKTESFLVHSDSFGGGYPRRYVRLPFLRFMSKAIDDDNGYVIIGDFFIRFGRTEQNMQLIEDMFKDWYAGISSIGENGYKSNNSYILSKDKNKVETQSTTNITSYSSYIYDSYWMIWGKVDLGKLKEKEKDENEDKDEENESDPSQGWADTSHEFQK